MDAQQVYEQARHERYMAQDGIEVSCGCVFCDVGNEPFKLKRRWVHHFRKTGRLIMCNVKNVKSGA